MLLRLTDADKQRLEKYDSKAQVVRLALVHFAGLSPEAFLGLRSGQGGENLTARLSVNLGGKLYRLLSLKAIEYQAARVTVLRAFTVAYLDHLDNVIPIDGQYPAPAGDWTNEPGRMGPD